MSKVFKAKGFEVRPAERRLLAHGQPVSLGGRAFDLLVALIYISIVNPDNLPITTVLAGLVSSQGGGIEFLGAFPNGLTIGAKLALPDRPVVGVIGDGSAMYTVQALWTAARYRIDVTFALLEACAA